MAALARAYRASAIAQRVEDCLRVARSYCEEVDCEIQRRVAQVMPINLSFLTFLILQLNSVLDTGRYDGVPISEVHAAIKRGAVLRSLKERCGEDIDLSLFLGPHGDREFEPWYEKKLQDIYGAYAGNERRKWGVENRGLCLLIAWTNELIQQGDGIDFKRV